MATSKTLAPTNQTISIPELSDSPDMSVPADAISKEADAINTLNSNIAKVLDSTTISGSTLAEVQTNLVTLISGMSDLSVRQIKFTLTSSTGQIESATYYGKVTRHNSTIAIVEIQSIAAIGDNSCIGTWRNSAWSWNRLALNEQIGNIRNVVVAEADVTSSGNGNFSVPLSSANYMLLTITVTSPDDIVAIPYKYGTGAGLLGGHAMSCLSAQTAQVNTNMHIKYAYVAI